MKVVLIRKDERIVAIVGLCWVLGFGGFMGWWTISDSTSSSPFSNRLLDFTDSALSFIGLMMILFVVGISSVVMGYILLRPIKAGLWVNNGKLCWAGSEAGEKQSYRAAIPLDQIRAIRFKVPAKVWPQNSLGPSLGATVLMTRGAAVPVPDCLTVSLYRRRIIAALKRVAPHVEFEEEPEFPDDASTN